MAANMSSAATWVSFGSGGLNLKAAQKFELEIEAYDDDPPQKEYGRVNALAVFQDELYAAGYFDQAGGKPASNIAKWNGVKWSPIGQGADEPVHLLQVYNGELYAAGAFTKIGGKKIKNFAKWNGKEWSAVSEDFEASISALLVSGKDLYVAGSIFKVKGSQVEAQIAKWDGQSWTVLKKLPNDPYAIAVFQNELYAGGTFIEAGSNKPNLYKWTGKEWEGVASFDGGVANLLATDQQLIVSGYFTTMNRKPMGGVASFDGKKWSTVGNGLIHPAPRHQDYVSTFYAMNSQILAGGTIAYLEDERSASGAMWDGKNWKKIASGIDGAIVAFAEYKGELYAAGRFSTSDSISIQNFQFVNIAKLKK